MTDLSLHQNVNAPFDHHQRSFFSGRQWLMQRSSTGQDSENRRLQNAQL